MTFQILDLVVYARNSDKINRIKLKPGKVNLISGPAKTGKSQVINVIEYCLARGECPIAEGVILDHAAWFGLRIQLTDTQVFLARPSPEGASTSLMFLEAAHEVRIPMKSELVANTNADAVEKYLTRSIGITPNLHVPPEGHTRPPIEANVRHALFFTSQAQNEIANKDILFHRQSEQMMFNTIRDTLPYFLGAVEENQLSLLHELQEAKRELKLATRALAEADTLQGEGVSRGHGLLAEARQYGIIPEGPSPPTEGGVRALLEPGLRWRPADVATLSNPRLTEYQERRESLRRDYAEWSRKAKEIELMAAETSDFAKEVTEQTFRLETINVYPSQAGTQTQCPLCLRATEAPRHQEEQMRASITALKANLSAAQRERPRFEEYGQKVQGEISKIRREAGQVEMAIEAIVRDDERAKNLRDRNAQAAQVVGRISFYLENPVKEENVDEFKAAAESARARVDELEERLSREASQDRLAYILDEVSRRMTQLAIRLGLEHSEKPVRLDIPRLTVLVERQGRFTPLSRIGSGENHEGYHVVTYLALHEWFTTHNRPVPRFLFLDQPTQIYYGGVQRDRERVKELFKLFSDTCESLEGKFQMIITEHADFAEDPAFKGHVAEDWWKGGALIPPEWIPAE